MKIKFISCLEVDSSNEKNAGSKAVQDIEYILSEMNGIKIRIPLVKECCKLRFHLNNAKRFKEKIFGESNKQSSVLIIQMPISAHSIFLSSIIKKIKKQGVKVLVLIHDLEFIRHKNLRKEHWLGWLRMYFEEISMIKQADAVIVHNEKMCSKLQKYGIDHNKMVSLEIFDYLAEKNPSHENRDDTCHDRIVIAGNLDPDKSGYVYDLPEAPQFLLYGGNYVSGKNMKENISYMGSYMPEQLPNVMQGDFGLVWDGDSIDTCAGPYGEYLRYNNPHKTSLYLACGIPVLIWKESALAPFILENNIGMTIENLNEISVKLEELSTEQYEIMKTNAVKISKKIRNGYFFKTALNKCVEIINV